MRNRKNEREKDCRIDVDRDKRERHRGIDRDGKLGERNKILGEKERDGRIRRYARGCERGRGRERIQREGRN